MIENQNKPSDELKAEEDYFIALFNKIKSHPLANKLLFGKLNRINYLIFAIFVTVIPFLLLNNLPHSILRNNFFIEIFFSSAFSILCLIFGVLFSFMRTRDIVTETNLLPYFLGVFLLSLLPGLNFILSIFLILAPTNYLNPKKRTQIIAKIQGT